MCRFGNLCGFVGDHIRIDMATHIPEPSQVSGDRFYSLVRRGDVIIQGFLLIVTKAYCIREIGREVNGSEYTAYAVPSSILPTDIDDTGRVSVTHPVFATLNKYYANESWQKVASATIVTSRVSEVYGQTYDAIMLQSLAENK